MEPEIELAANYGLPQKRLGSALKLVQEHKNEIRRAWKEHFGS